MNKTVHKDALQLKRLSSVSGTRANSRVHKLEIETSIGCRRTFEIVHKTPCLRACVIFQNP